jgi:hypothetical protein
MQVREQKVAEIGVSARLVRNCWLIEVKLNAHDKTCQQVVERRIKTPQIKRDKPREAPTESSTEPPRQSGDAMKSHQRLSSKMLHRMFETQLGSLDE